MMDISNTLIDSDANLTAILSQRHFEHNLRQRRPNPLAKRFHLPPQADSTPVSMNPRRTPTVAATPTIPPSLSRHHCYHSDNSSGVGSTGNNRRRRRRDSNIRDYEDDDRSDSDHSYTASFGTHPKQQPRRCPRLVRQDAFCVEATRTAPRQYHRKSTSLHCVQDDSFDHVDVGSFWCSQEATGPMPYTLKIADSANQPSSLLGRKFEFLPHQPPLELNLSYTEIDDDDEAITRYLISPSASELSGANRHVTSRGSRQRATDNSIAATSGIYQSTEHSSHNGSNTTFSQSQVPDPIFDHTVSVASSDYSYEDDEGYTLCDDSELKEHHDSEWAMVHGWDGKSQRAYSRGGSNISNNNDAGAWTILDASSTQN